MSPQVSREGLEQSNLGIVRRRKSLFATSAVAFAMLAGATAASSLASGGGVTPPGGTAPPPATTSSTGHPDWTIVQKATWYGPGLWGHNTACGTVLTPGVIGVANKRLPCGTQVTFSYGGRSVSASVIDRGPFRKGYAWDLTKRAAKLIGFLPVGAGSVTAAVTLPR